MKFNHLSELVLFARPSFLKFGIGSGKDGESHDYEDVLSQDILNAPICDICIIQSSEVNALLVCIMQYTLKCHPCDSLCPMDSTASTRRLGIARRPSTLDLEGTPSISALRKT
jgi:hypothetical protein